MRTGQLATPNPVTVTLEATVVEAATLMREQHVGTLIVVDRGRPVAMLTDRDVAIGAVAQAPDRLGKLLVSDLVVAGEVHAAHADEPVWKTLKRMRDRGVRRMPVIDERDALVGLISLDDVLLQLAEQLSDVAALLERQPTKEFFRRS